MSNRGGLAGGCPELSQCDRLSSEHVQRVGNQALEKSEVCEDLVKAQPQNTEFTPTMQVGRERACHGMACVLGIQLDYF